MLGKIIGGLVGARAARNSRGVDEPGGALMGVAAVTLARRFGLPGIVAAAAAGYGLKRYNEKRRTKSISGTRY